MYDENVKDRSVPMKGAGGGDRGRVSQGLDSVNFGLRYGVYGAKMWC